MPAGSKAVPRPPAALAGGRPRRRSPLVSLIAAVARNAVIGAGNRLPWHLPADLRRFRAITWAKPIVMGRRTHESIGRALPGRRNVVVTRRGSVLDGCERAGSLGAALAMTADAPETVVIGGERCYREALPLAERLYLTRIDADFEGDAWFPEWDPAEWAVHERERFAAGAGSPTGAGPAGPPAPFGYEFLVLERQSTDRTSPD